jgi:sterol desaturase/sphingolipid hydroxylase (fatty acid hydroxylase superfamily)
LRITKTATGTDGGTTGEDAGVTSLQYPKKVTIGGKNSIIEAMKWLSGAVTIGTFAVLYFLEKRRPLRRQIYQKEIETGRNLAIAGVSGLVLNFLEKPITNKLTKFVEEKNVGLLKIIRLPRFLETALAVLLLDYTLYLWHVLTHKVPFLWNFHRIHHADLDLQASTAIRFHFGEITISVAFRMGQIMLIGVSPKALEIWQNLLFISILFHHSNVRLPKNIEEILEKFIVTPRLHGIHHSVEEAEMNSNWSSCLSFWDNLHGTFRNDISQDEIQIGVKEFATEAQVTFGKMLAEPLQNINSPQNLLSNR